MDPNLVALIEKKIEAAVSALETSEQWKNYLNLGAAECTIAGSHQGRYLLELLQNARDAAKDCQGGHVLVVVTGKAVHVANSGRPFEFDKQKVLDAVCHLSRSTKLSSEGFIGHKGIGMKSILLQASWFSITTRLGLKQEPVRLDFSRAKTACLLKEKLTGGNVITEEEFCAELPRLPLFILPHPHPKQSNDSLFSLAGITEPSVLPPDEDLSLYQTVVSLYFPQNEGDEWTSWMEEARKRLCDPDHQRNFEQSRKNFALLNARSGEGSAWEEIDKIKPEAIILMGTLDRVTFVRLDDSGKVIARRLINVERQLVAEEERYRIHYVKVIKCSEGEQPGNRSQERHYLLVEPPAAPREDPEVHDAVQCALLIPIPSEDVGLQPKSQPLYLYYPIDKQYSGLPFILHGTFQVSPDRSQLWEKEAEHNNQVVDAAVRLLKDTLPALAQNASLRHWLPWLLLPVTGKDADRFESEIARKFREMLATEAWVPTSKGLRKPEEVHVLLDNPWAFRLFRHYPGEWNRFILLEDECLQHYVTTRSSSSEGETKYLLKYQADQIGLGRFAHDPFFDLLAEFGQAVALHENASSSPDLFPLNYPHAEHDALMFIHAVCHLVEQLEPHAMLAQAWRLGKNRVPLLPTTIADKTYLVRAWNGDAGDGYDVQKKRVVFYPTQQTDVTKMPALADKRISVYKMPAKLLEYSSIKKFEDSWTVYAYSGLPDEFRRISERLDEVEEYSPDLLGYLAGLLWRLQPKEDSDLYPRPYAHIDLELLKKLLSGKQSDERETLLREQGWQRVLVPVHSGGFQPAGSVIFGGEWADLLGGDAEDEQLAMLIRKNLRLSPQEAQICPPDDPTWEKALRVIVSFDEDLPELVQKRALFRLLLLFGVRLGPKAEWRWLDLEHASDAVGPENQISRGFVASKTVSPRGKLYQDYQEWVRLGKNNPGKTISFGVSWSYGEKLKNGIFSGKEYLAALIWFPDLAIDARQLEENGINPDGLAAWCIAWITCSPYPKRLFDTVWFSEKTGRGLISSAVKSFAYYQITRLPIWAACAPFDEDRRYPACVLVPQEPAEPVKKDECGAILGFPSLNFSGGESEADKKSIEKELEIIDIKNMDSLSAIEHLRWLLEQWSEGDRPDGETRWRLKTPRDFEKWRRFLYSLFGSIADQPEWCKCSRITIPVVEIVTQTMYAVPYDEKIFNSIQYFDHAPHEWERKKLREKDVLIFLAQDRTLNDELQTWANKVGMKAVKEKRGQISQTRFLHDEQATKAVNEAQHAVHDRLYLLMGFLWKSIQKIETMKERYQTITTAVENMRAVTDPLVDEVLGEGEKEGTLLLSLMDYDGGKNLACLAHGLVVLLNVEADQLLNFVYALNTEPRQVERILLTQDVDLADLFSKLPELEKNKLGTLARKRAGAFLLFFGSSTKIDSEEDLYKVVEVVLNETSLSNSNLLERILTAPDDCTEDVIELARQLYTEINRTGHSYQPEELQAVYNAIFPRLVRRIEEEPYVTRYLNRLAVVRWLLEVADQDGASDLWQAQILFIREKLNLTSLYWKELAEWTPDLISLYKPPYLFLWKLMDWEGLSCDLEEWAELNWKNFERLPTGIQEELRNCLNEGTLPGAALPAGHRSGLPEFDKITLVEQFESGQLFYQDGWSPETIKSFAYTAQPQSLGNVSGGGEGSGRKREDVSLLKQHQGEIAELFVIEEIWQRFLAMNDPCHRAAVWQKIIRLREREGLVGKWKLDTLREHTTRMAESPEGDKSMFRQAIDLSDYGIAGFDVIDPFGRRNIIEAENLTPCLVEVKSISTTDHPSIVMTAHEYRTAMKNPQEYVLRVVLVPPEEKYCYPNEYRMIDFSNIIEELDLDVQLRKTIRRGVFDVPLPPHTPSE